MRLCPKMVTLREIIIVSAGSVFSKYITEHSAPHEDRKHFHRLDY